MRSLAFVLICSMSVAAYAQPKHRGAHPAPPPPPPASAPGSSEVPPPPPPPGDMPPQANQPLLQRDTEVRRAFHFEAFIDAELGIINKDYYPTRGFTLNDAAIYLSKDFGRGFTGMIDLPFASVPQDLTAGAAASTTAIGFGQSRAQAFAQWTNEAWMVKAGQWDTIFGYERNDSRDRFFANAGLLKSAILPYTHVGALLGYQVQQVSLRAMIADPADLGTMANQNPEFGVQARYDGANLFGAAGLSVGDQKNGPGSNMLIDAMLGIHQDKITGALYFDDKKKSGVDKHATGFGVQGSFAMNPELGIGARVEYVSDASAAIKNQFAIAAGPSYRLMPDLTLRGDADVSSLSPVTGDNVTIFGVQGSLVANF